MSMDGKDKLGVAAAVIGTGYVMWDGYERDSTISGGWGPIVPAVEAVLYGSGGAVLGGLFFGRRWAGAAVCIAALAGWRVYKRNQPQPALPMNPTLPAVP